MYYRQDQSPTIAKGEVLLEFLNQLASVVLMQVETFATQEPAAKEGSRLPNLEP